MKYLGGFADLVAFRDYVDHVDARAWDEVLIAMAGEADANRITETEMRMKAQRHANHA